MSELVFNNLSKVFGGKVKALDGFSLAVRPGELMVLLGPSGCGKTTLLRLAAGLDEPGGGDILLGGRSIRAVPPPRRPFALVFQNYALYPHLSARENLTYALRVQKLPRAEIGQRLRETVELMRLTPGELERKPAELSGGQRQRVALGKAIMRKPQVFLLDEPLSNLDQKLRIQLRSELKRIQRALKATMLLVTHDQNEAMALGDRIAVLDRGRVEQVGAPAELYQKPNSMFVAGFLASPPMNLINGRVQGKGGDLYFREKDGGSIAFRLPPEQAGLLASHGQREVVLGLRPEAVRTTARPGQDIPQGRAGIGDVEFLGPVAYLHLDSGSHRLSSLAGGNTRAAPGGEVNLFLDLERLSFFDPATGKVIRAKSQETLDITAPAHPERA